MPYDPRMLQMAQMGVRMMGPEQRNAFADPRSQQQPQQPKPWWEQAIQVGKPTNRAVNTPDSEDPNAPRKPQPSLLQMLMLGGSPTYSGTPRSSGASQWDWLGNMGQPGGGGYR